MSNFVMTFFSFLLKSQYYQVPPDEAGSVVGLFGFFAQFVCLFFDFGLGTIMDAFGRKIPCISGLFLGGIALIIMPFGEMLYPTLLILR